MAEATVSRSAELIERICSNDPRLPGSDSERRAAKQLAAELAASGRRVEVEPIWVQPQWAVVHMLHCVLAAVGSMIAAIEPAAAFAMVLIAATSFYLDLTGRRYALRRLLFRRASQNVISPGPVPPGAAGRVVLCANYDAPRTGAVYNPAPARLWASLARRLPVAASPPRVVFWSMALLLPVLGLRMAGLDAASISLLQLPQTLVLIVAAFAYGEIALSPASPGANDNASGVAAALETARRLDDDPPATLAVGVALIGAGETTMEGMRAFLRDHRTDLDRERTWIVALDSVGRGELRYLTSEGPAVSVPMDPTLVELCDALATPDGDGGTPRAEPMRHGQGSAAFYAQARRLRAIAITCREPGEPLPAGHHSPADTPDRVDPEAVERAASFAVELVRLLDRDLSRRAGRSGPEDE